MKKLLVLSFLLPQLAAHGQLPDGSTAPDFTLTDLNGNTHHLYSYLNAGKTVFVEIFAAHCPTCWSYHQTHVLKNMHEQYGPDGTDELMVLALEYDQWNGLNELMGIGDPWVTAGDWITGTPYPICNVEDPDRGVFTDYNVTGYPAIYKICPDGLTERLFTSQPEALLYQLMQNCQAAVSIMEGPDLGSIRIDPVSGSLIIDHHQHVLGVEVFDAQGRMMKHAGPIGGPMLDLAGLDTGVYLFRVRTGSGVVVKRLPLVR